MTRKTTLMLWMVSLVCVFAISGCGRPSVTDYSVSTTTPAAPARVTLPVTLRPDDPAFAKADFVPGSATNPPSWFWSLGTFRGPRLAVPNNEDIEITIHLANYYPANINPKLTATVNGQQVFAEQLNGAILNQQKAIGPIHVPASLHRGQLEVIWQTDTWVPAEIGMSSKDNRSLGLDIVSFEVQSAAK